ncbi:fibronectin type III domain-containing protein [Patescibacteria group bacterium]|nr:fibronectin type III domain-containing protein [Patescibacteria group bacterium]MBU1016247.1 fibronectin type III domain-containing protein [Patescibacteria group bacterium]MBU1685479.1 fibronectin type III domain-containing protein [Patescibacteria group bacterium]MBU1939105.1 fibronectin type III domain-containing protein [Patescibacteria group bacterium]
MIRRLFPVIIAAVILAPSLAFSAYEQALRVTATDVVDYMNNFVLVDKHGEKWLLHHKTGCGSVKEGDELTLVIRGELDGNRDEMWKGTYNSCVIDQAEFITGTMTVTTVTPADTYTSVSDNGKPYRIYYSERCKAMTGMNHKDVYVRKFGGKQLKAGDKFFLPGAGEMCAITYVMPQGEALPEPEPVIGDVKRPTTPTHVRAVPTTSAVYLYWNKAKDNENIAYYVISASLYHRDDPVARDPSVKPQEMQNTIKTETNKNSFRLDNLDSDELYFFRVIAVDTSGNESSYWSEEATAFTKSSIAQLSLANAKLRLFRVQETADSFLFRWTNLSDSKYSVILEVNDERVFISNDWKQTYFRVLKKPERKGEKLELIVRSLNYRGFSQEATSTFSF